jgi:hypothetical protein
MRIAVRATAVGVLAFAVAVMLGLTSMTSLLAVTSVAATTALIMGGSGDPLSTPKDTIEFIQGYMNMTVDNYIAPASTATPATGIPQGPYNQVAVITPAQFANSPNSGELTFDQSVAEGLVNLDNCVNGTGCVYNQDVGSTAPSPTDTFVIAGYSQSATIATFEKRRLAAQYAAGEGPDVSFVFLANGNRPNGGRLARGPEGVTIPWGQNFGGATYSGPTPTNTQYESVDIAGQYDPWADAPLNPYNPFASYNAMMGGTYVHPNYGNVSINDPGIINQGQFGDTTYYLIPTKILPMLMPLTGVPVIGYAMADGLDPFYRVLVEAGYDRTISPGQPTPWNPQYSPDPMALAVNLAVAIPTGWDNMLENTIGIRPFGTVRPGPYGVGGPDVTYQNPPATTALTATTESTAQTVTGTAAAALTDSSTDVEDSTADSQSGDGLGTSALSDVESLRDSAADDLAALAESVQSSADPKPEDATESETVTGEESLNGNTTTDVPTSDAATTPPSTTIESGDESTPPARGPRHALPDTATSASNSTAAGDQSTPSARGPRHALPDTATTASKTSATSTKTSPATAGASSTAHDDSTSQGSEGDSAQ